jgi:hypothetical protein
MRALTVPIFIIGRIKGCVVLKTLALSCSILSVLLRPTAYSPELVSGAYVLRTILTIGINSPLISILAHSLSLVLRWRRWHVVPEVDFILTFAGRSPTNE